MDVGTSKSNLSTMSNFLERFIPSAFSSTNYKETIDFAANILDSILKLNGSENNL